jgi:hypothetical protein
MQLKAKMLVVVGLLLVTTLFAYKAFAAPYPEGPSTIARGDSERKTDADPIVVQAQAGNVTALTINATRITERWQGYYGNITGTIVLDDANNNSMYSWSIASPEGEIYAVNSSSTPVWSDVFCFNFSNNKTDPDGRGILQRFNGTDLENASGMRPTDVDGIDETFNRTFARSFQVGSNTIDSSSGCSVVGLNVNSAYQESEFQEVLLTDNNSIIYTAILEQDETGFQGSTLDFQMIVAENGDVEEATNYYFYVELS